MCLEHFKGLNRLFGLCLSNSNKRTRKGVNKVWIKRVRKVDEDRPRVPRAKLSDRALRDRPNINNVGERKIERLGDLDIWQFSFHKSLAKHLNLYRALFKIVTISQEYLNNIYLFHFYCSGTDIRKQIKNTILK